MSEVRMHVVRAGRFRRKSDGKSIQRFRCRRCLRYFSRATFSPCYRQNKRRLNHEVYEHLASEVSQRRSARLLRCNRKTIAKKFKFVALRCQADLESQNKLLPKAKIVEFDELETIEHSKCKPLSVLVAVNENRKFLVLKVCRMPAKGRLAKIALKKYGPRVDERPRGRKLFFESLKQFVEPTALFKSDENPFYPKDLLKAFPRATHQRFKGQRGSTTGQGELKRVRFDPLFKLNHSCAMLRANINRLIRKTWCTTKIPENLALHLAI